MFESLCKKKKAFSVAEAMIALLIGSIALGMAAPMITKQLKTQNFSDTQSRFLLERMERLEAEMNPEGIIRFFYDRACPPGWTPITAADGRSLDGHYLRLSSSSDDDEIGTTLEPALPNIIAGFPGVGQYHGGVKPAEFWAEDTDKDGLYGAIVRRNVSDHPKNGVRVGNQDTAEREDYFHFDASKYNSVYGALGDVNGKEDDYAKKEVRPRSVLISACRKL